MLRELEHLVNSFLPPINPEAVRRLREALSKRGDLASSLFLPSSSDPIRQGDILGPLPFVFQLEDGSVVGQDQFGMLISQSCDFDHDLTVLFAPCISAADFESASGKPAATANEKTNLIFMPGFRSFPDLVVDLTRIQPLPTAFVSSEHTNGGLSRSHSLSQAGYYFLLAKLTLHLLRPVGREEPRSAPPPDRVEALRWVWLDLRCSIKQNLSS